MSNIVNNDLTGEIYGKLTVAAYHSTNHSGKRVWQCLCSCGNEYLATTTDLRTGECRSCGCTKRFGVRCEDLTGQRFGRLVVLERGPDGYTRPGRTSVRWYCQCDCGTIHLTPATCLKRGTSRSCGCLQRESAREQELEDLSGQRFGKLSVVEISQRMYHGRIYWSCRCDCGSMVETQGRYLRRGTKQSCGCLHKTTSAVTNARHIYNSYKSAARRAQRSFTLSEEQFVALLASNCYYCGVPPSNTLVLKRKTLVPYQYNGIDRVDSSKGYEHDNVVACCCHCNLAKGTRSVDEYISRCNAVAKKHPQL